MIAEFRDGAGGVDIVPMQNGRPSGESAFVSSSLPVRFPPRTMSNGTVVMMSGGFPTVEVVSNSLDAQNRPGVWRPLELVDPGNGPNILWSPDGRQIAYDTAAGVIRLLNVSSGEDRELYRTKLQQILETCLWARQHPNLYCGKIGNTKTEIISVPLGSGSAEKIGELEGRRIILRLSDDDRKLYNVTTQSFVG